MGIETIIFASLTALSAASKMNDAKDQAKNITRNATAQAQALADQGSLAAKEKAKEIRYKAALQKSSFLTSGLTMEGTPTTVLDETFTTGLEDINNITKGYNNNITNTVRNANAQAKSTISSARSQVISDIAGSFAGANLSGSAQSMFNTSLSYAPESFLTGLNGTGLTNNAFDALELKDARGY